MIYLSTGGNGAGKTLFTLKDVRDQQLKENRPVYFHGFTPKPILLEWGWQEFDPKKWQDLPDGSICIFDECQNEFPAKIQGELPDYINAVAQYRRKRGFDFWMITPHPSLIHVNIRRLIESPSWHRHFKRLFGSEMVSELQFNFAELKCEQPGAGARGTVSTRKYPKEVYDWYESASLHTGKRRIPKQVWLLAACAVAIPVLGYYGFKGATRGGAKPAESAAVSVQQAAADARPMGPARTVMTAAEYVSSFKPRLSDFVHTAPRYDEVTKPVIAPYPAACVSAKNRCDCYTQQGTKMAVSAEVCGQIVRNGYFVDWQLSQDRGQPAIVSDAPKQPEVRPPAGRVVEAEYRAPDLPPQIGLSDVVRAAESGRLPGQADGYSQGLAARNAQVRSVLQ